MKFKSIINNLFGSPEKKIPNETNTTQPEKKIPNGKVIEGTSTLQIVCPVCSYGKGYNEPMPASPREKIEVQCPTCGTIFFSLE